MREYRNDHPETALLRRGNAPAEQRVVTQSDAQMAGGENP